jgi:hypothetical protein
MANPAGDLVQALAMLDIFASVGTERFDVTTTDLQGHKLLFLRAVPIAALRRSIPQQLLDSIRYQQNLIIRPQGPKVQFVQLDDLDPDGIIRAQPAAFLSLETSPGNYQAWLALQPPGTEDFVRRLRKGTGADPSASGATRVAGSLNFKPKYAGNFPQVTIAGSSSGHFTTCEQLETLNLVAPPPVFLAPLRSPRPGRERKGWPSYDKCLAGAPPNRDQAGPDISRVDFTWCMLAIDWGWGTEETADRLMEISQKARENGEQYAIRTATRAAEAVARNRQPQSRSTPD